MEQREVDNMLLSMIQKHFPSLPLSDEHTDWGKWLGFARAVYEAGRASPASVPEGFTMSEPAILPDGSGFGTMTEREATLLGKVERQSAALKLAREALQGIHPGNMTPMAEKNWMEAIAAIDSLQKGE